MVALVAIFALLLVLADAVKNILVIVCVKFALVWRAYKLPTGKQPPERAYKMQDTSSLRVQ